MEIQVDGRDYEIASAANVRAYQAAVEGMTDPMYSRQGENLWRELVNRQGRAFEEAESEVWGRVRLSLIEFFTVGEQLYAAFAVYRDEQRAGRFCQRIN